MIADVFSVCWKYGERNDVPTCYKPKTAKRHRRGTPLLLPDSILFAPFVFQRMFHRFIILYIIPFFDTFVKQKHILRLLI